MLPDEAHVVIQRPKYWSPRFCWLYFERCDELIWEAPDYGLVAAEVCPELVSLTEMKTRESHPRLQLHALVVLGTATCATGALDQAEEQYREAFQLAKANRRIMRSDVANLLYRFGYLLCCRDRTASAVKAASQSIEVYREAPDDIRGRHLGEALLARGFIHHRDGYLERAMTDWAEAISCTEVKQTPRVWHTALHNLAVGVMRGGVPARELSQVEGYVTRACRSSSKELLSVPKLKMCWARGMIQIRFGSTRRGEATYRKTMDGFLKLGEIVDLALVRVTLGRHLQREGRCEELKTLAVETHELCEQLCPHDNVKRTVVAEWGALELTFSANVNLGLKLLHLKPHGLEKFQRGTQAPQRAMRRYRFRMFRRSV